MYKLFAAISTGQFAMPPDLPLLLQDLLKGKEHCKQVHVQTYMYTLYTCTLYMLQKGCHFTDAVFEEWPPSLLTLGSMSSSVTNLTSRSLSVALSDA